MWNDRYAKANKLPDPREWQDLAKPAYFDHVSIAAPSRSGTTHLTIETILQGEGWDKGWRTIKEIESATSANVMGNVRSACLMRSTLAKWGTALSSISLRSQPLSLGLPRQVRLSLGHHHCSRQRRSLSPTRRTR